MFRRLSALSSLANTLNCFLLLSAILFPLTPNAFAGQVKLAWDANSESILAGYRLHYGEASRNYTADIDVGNQTSYTATNLDDGKTYYFAVTAYDTSGTIKSDFSNEVSYTIPTSVALNADFTATPTSGPAPLTVTFIDTSSGSINTRNWDFGDGKSSTAQTAVTTYSDPGTYSVTLNVADASGNSDAITKNDFISVGSAVPVADFSANPMSGTSPLTVNFTNQSTGTISEYSWDFGDGSSSAEQNPSHEYSVAGTYTVTLTVTGPGGSDSEIQTDYIAVATSGGGDPAPGEDPGADPGTPKEGLVAAYGFEELTGNEVDDSSDESNHGVISGATRIDEGRFGKALAFDGIDDWVTVKDADSLDLTSGLTLEAWLYPTEAMDDWRCVLIKERRNGLAYSLCANSDTNQPSTAVHIRSDRNLKGGPQLQANQWAHVAATYDGATQRLYVNGTEVAKQPLSGTIRTSDRALRIGGTAVWNEFFKGRIDEVRVYNRALTQSEIQSDMDNPVLNSSIDPAPDDTTPSACSTSCSLWDDSAIPNTLQDSDTSAVEVGVKFQSDVDGFVTGIRFYKGSQNTGTHVGSLWASDGTLLAQATFTNETDSGWQQVAFATPVPIVAGTVYVASYHTTVGRYSVDEGYFASTYNSGPLSAPSDTESGGNGVYLYGNGGFPNKTYQASNYWIDVLFKTE